MKRIFWLCLLTCCALVLHGCGQKKAPEAAKPGAVQAALDHHEDSRIEKGSLYADLYDEISVYKSLGQRTAAMMASKGMGKKPPKNDRFEYMDTYLELYQRTSEKLHKAQSMPGEMAELDSAGQELLQAVDAALPNMAALDTYQKTNKYEDDSGAAGFPMQKQLVADMAKIDAAYEKLDQQLNAFQKAEHTKKLAQLKASGDFPMLNAQEGLDAAEEIFHTFSELDDFKDAKRIDRANAALALLESKAEAMQAEYAKEKQKANHRNTGGFDMLHGNFIEFASAYREMRKEPTVENLGQMVGCYHSIISSMNNFY